MLVQDKTGGMEINQVSKGMGREDAAFAYLYKMLFRAGRNANAKEQGYQEMKMSHGPHPPPIILQVSEQSI